MNEELGIRNEKLLRLPTGYLNKKLKYKLYSKYDFNSKSNYSR